MMAWLPTWAELLQGAIDLAKVQKECYDSVHYMLDTSLPDLDRKLSLLNPVTRSKSSTLLRTTQPKEIFHSRTHNSLKEFSQHGPALAVDYAGDHFYEQICEPAIAISANDNNGCVSHMPQTSSPIPNVKPAPKSIPQVSHQQKEKGKQKVKPNLSELVYLRPPEKPLSYYLKKKRPDFVRAADRRVMHLKKKSERRKQIASSRSMNFIEVLRASSRTSSLKSSCRTITKTTYNNNNPPTIRHKLSEQEMKRLTARVYNRLPEVKRQRNDEVTKHMKVQNYKNKMEYGRKLLMNRRQGVINYPLRATDSSTTSSLEESFNNSLE